ncbi:hypothetical protein TSMEX_002158, partial [Taenia solium]
AGLGGGGGQVVKVIPPL